MRHLEVIGWLWLVPRGLTSVYTCWQTITLGRFIYSTAGLAGLMLSGALLRDRLVFYLGLSLFALYALVVAMFARCESRPGASEFERDVV